jgi:hypothetical protein
LDEPSASSVRGTVVPSTDVHFAGLLSPMAWNWIWASVPSASRPQSQQAAASGGAWNPIAPAKLASMSPARVPYYW